ncbi:MAG: hypothetical protein AAFY72_13725 [Cyanobacteria bacterium J06649_4]
MVFATDFDPLEQPQRHQTSDLSKIKSATDLGTHQTYDDLPVATRQRRQPSGHGQLRKGQLSASQTRRARAKEAEAQRIVTEAAIAEFERDASVAQQQSAQKGNAQKGSSVLTIHASSSTESATKPLSFSKRASLPFGLTLLNRMQQGSAVVATALISSALLLYGSTVYVDKSTSRALIQLDALQSESQQLTTANEAIKQSLAEQATLEDSGLELYEAGDVLFLAPEPVREAKPLPEETTEKLQPLGY